MNTPSLTRHLRTCIVLLWLLLLAFECYLPSLAHAQFGPVRRPIKTLVVRLSYPDPADNPPVTRGGVPMTVEAVRATMDEANARLKEDSYGKDSLSATIVPEVLVLSKSNKPGAPNRITLPEKFAEAVAKARALNFNIDDYDLLTIFENGGGGGLGGGLSEIRTKTGGQALYAQMEGTLDPAIVLHETGHTGVMINGGHGNLWKVSDGNPLSETAESLVYGDRYDPQGGGQYRGADWAMPTKLNSGWIGAQHLPTVTTSSRHTIHRYDHPQALTFNGGAPKLGLKIPRDVTPKARSFYVGYRRNPTPEPNPYINNGAYIVWDDLLNEDYAIIDTQTPGTDVADAALPIGKTLNDTAKSIFITPVGRGGVAPAETLDVQVNIGPFPGNQPPVASIAAPPGIISLGVPVTFTATATDPDGDELAYYWQVVGAPAPANGNVNAATFNATFAVGGSVTVKCIVSDMKGGEVTATTTVTAYDPLLTLAPRISNVTGKVLGLASIGANAIAVVEGAGAIGTGNGLAWTKRAAGADLADPTSFALNGVGAGNGLFVAIGGKNGNNERVSYVATSPDGAAWTSRTTPATTPQLYSVAFGGGLFVAVGDAGGILTSPDGVAWTARTSGVTKTLQSVTFGAAGFVAVGPEQSIVHSADGLTWTNQSYTRFTGDDLNFQQSDGTVAFGAGLYVIADGSTLVLSSPDGKVWTKRRLPGLYEVRQVTFAHGQFLAVARKHADDMTSPATLSSVDGLTWVERAITPAGNYFAVTGYQSTFLLGGESGTILQTGTLGAGAGAAAPAITSATSATGTRGAPFRYEIAAGNNPASFDATGLPAGLTLDAATGAITGKPDDPGVANVTLTATNVVGTSAPVGLTITVGAAKPTITSAATASGSVGQNLSYQITASDDPTSYAATGLPGGLTLDTATGAITGTLTEAIRTVATVTATNAAGSSSLEVEFTINAIVASPAITSGLTLNGVVGQAIGGYNIDANNNPDSVNATNLPTGLTFDAGSGSITGTPTTAGTFKVTLTATNAQGTGKAILTVTVGAAAIADALGAAAPAPAPAFARLALVPPPDVSGWVGGGAAIPFAQAAVTHGGALAVQTGPIDDSETTFIEATVHGPGTVRFWWKVSSEQDLDFLTVSLDGNALASISGEVDWEEVEIEIPDGEFTLRIAYTKDAAGSFGSDAGWVDDFRFFAAPPYPEITSATETTGELGQNFSYQIVATQDPTSYAALHLPAGLALNTTTGRITGIPTEFGPFLATLTARNASGTSAPVELSIVIGGPVPVITSELAVTTEVTETPFTYQVAATGAPYRFTASPLPEGILFDEETGVLSGRIFDPGVFVVQLGAVNAAGTGMGTLTVTVEPKPVELLSGNFYQAYRGAALSYFVQVHGEGVAFSATGLPPGLTIDPATGEITGTPTTAGQFVARVTVTEGTESETFPLTLLIGPPNDDFADATTLEGSVFGGDGVNTDASVELDEPNHAGSASSHSLWWTWTAPRAGRVVLSTAGSTFDTVLAVYRGGALSDLVEVAANDNARAGETTSRVIFNAVAGDTYRIAAGGGGAATGTIVLNGRYDAAAIYSGLVQSLEAPELNGFGTIAVSRGQSFTLRLRLGSASHSLRGSFDAADGTFTGSIPRRGRTALTVELALDREHGTDAITGTIDDGTDAATLWAEAAQKVARRASSEQRGRYTVAILSEQGVSAQPAAEVPQGHGYGTAVVSREGKLRFTGRLGDGTVVSQGLTLAGDGGWPFYVAAYRPLGSATGWIFFADSGAATTLEGSLTWTKPAAANGRGLYPDGFLVELVPVIGSAYTPPPRGTKVLDLTVATFTLGDGGSGEGEISHAALLGSNNALAVDGGKVKLFLSTGLFDGTATDADGTARRVRGALLQSEDAGFGFFTGTGRTGVVELQAAP